MEAPPSQARTKRHWTPSEASFRRLLDWLDAGVDSGGERYLEMRRRLNAYFDRRGCRAPDDLADDTLNRVARRLEEEGYVRDPGDPRLRRAPIEAPRDRNLRKMGEQPAARPVSGGRRGSGLRAGVILPPFDATAS